ncbi:hypothetical protein, partial [Aquabacterium sp.]|uniref:hypothetical protein n=1 Tax=Aquabacterium sp. TaxID=1872578 RepID=UPI0025C45909
HPESVAKTAERLADPAGHKKRKGRELRIKYKDARREYNQRYRAENRDLYARCERERYARKRNAMPAWADLEKIAAFYAEARRLTLETGIQHEVDHIYPLNSPTICGLHVHQNMQILTRSENASKGNRYAG